jgi:hypothetical protein
MRYKKKQEPKTEAAETKFLRSVASYKRRELIRNTGTLLCISFKR